MVFRPIRLSVAILLLLPVLVVALLEGPVRAQSGPSIELDKSEVSPGDSVIVSLRGFNGDLVTVAVCGNLGKRGSADCAMGSSVSEQIRHFEDITLTQLLVEAPPVPCPCIIRAATNSNDEFAVAPIVVTGHPTGPVVSPRDGPLVEVDLHAERVPAGAFDSIRSWLGGPTDYDVTVSVRNVTTESLANVIVRGSGGNRFDDEAVQLQFDQPGPIGPGQTWTQTVSVTLPAPAISTFTWSVDASGAGATITAVEATHPRPVLLYVLVGLLIVDLLVLAVRFPIRRRRRKARARARKLSDEAWSAPASDESVEDVLVS